MVDPDQRESILSAKRSLDSICTEFEDALKSGKRIRIESFTDRARSGTSRTRLLQALLEMELEYILIDRVPQEDEYLIRFPEDVPCVQKWEQHVRRLRFQQVRCARWGRFLHASPSRDCFLRKV